MNLCSEVQAWRKRRADKMQLRWARTRAKGKLRYVLWTICWFNIVMFAYIHVFDYLRGRPFDKSGLWHELPIFFIVSVLLAFGSWWWSEIKYEDFLRQEHAGKNRGTRVRHSPGL